MEENREEEENICRYFMFVLRFYLFSLFYFPNSLLLLLLMWLMCTFDMGIEYFNRLCGIVSFYFVQYMCLVNKIDKMHIVMHCAGNFHETIEICFHARVCIYVCAYSNNRTHTYKICIFEFNNRLLVVNRSML